MLNDENKELCWKVLAKYGISHQRNMVIEECAELQKAICKLFRDDEKPDGKHQMNFLEELVDVVVMCEQMILAEQINNKLLNTMARIKLERALNDKDKVS